LSLLQAIILGIIQGLTEYLPVSSSAHLVLVPWALGWEFEPNAAFAFDVLVQWGTLVAVIVYFWKDLMGMLRAAWTALRRRELTQDPSIRLASWIVLGTIPAVLAGLTLKDAVEAAFASPLATSAFLLVTAALLFVAERIGKRARPLESMTWVDAVWVGLAQALSIFPGISRSGATISAGLLRDLDRPPAARFSFLLSIPVMLGAGGLALADLAALPWAASFAPALIAGFAAAAIVGYASIRWMLAFVTRHSLAVFSIYCAVVGLAGLAAALVRGG
jgi:undecaprenyl-diphosphatase